MSPSAAPAAPSRVQQPLAALGRATDTVTSHVVIALGTIIVVQVGVTVALFFSINTNGWLTYQGGDQIWLVTRAGCSATGSSATR